MEDLLLKMFSTSSPISTNFLAKYDEASSELAALHDIATAVRHKSLERFKTTNLGSSLMICPLLSRIHPLRAFLVYLLRMYFGGITIIFQ